MRFHPGVDPEKAMFGYMQALQGFTIEAITAGILKFLRGECDGVNPKYCPHPPELAQIIRTAVIPQRIPPERRLAHSRQPMPGERERLRLKMPMYRHAYATGRMDELDAANRAGFGAMVVLASQWGIEVPAELLEIPDYEAEEQWRRARVAAWNEIERDPPPFLRNRKSA